MSFDPSLIEGPHLNERILVGYTFHMDKRLLMVINIQTDEVMETCFTK